MKSLTGSGFATYNPIGMSEAPFLRFFAMSGTRRVNLFSGMLPIVKPVSCAVFMSTPPMLII